MSNQILFLDDEAACLESYKSALGAMAADWEPAFFTDPKEALAAVLTDRPTIVVADYRMPDMDGVAFLSEVEKLHPQAQRLLAADRGDEELFEASIGVSFQFLPKPCSPAQLLAELQRCMAIDSWLGNENVKELVARMGAFPTLPPMYLKIMNALNSRSADAAQIAQAIAGDIAISAKVLQVVNSSYYGFEEKISDIAQAVGILGIETLKSLVMAVQVFGKLSRDADGKALADQLWHHSMSVAVAAKRLSAHETGDERLAEEAYTAGLLHDIGKLVMLGAAPEAFDQARDRAREAGIPQWQAEEEILGCNHAETGAYVLARWGMPAPVVEAVALHHKPVNSSGSAFCALTAAHVANALVWERHPGDEPHPDAAPDAGFLAEIGRAGDWDTWRDVASGKISEKKPGAARAFALKRSGPDVRDRPSTPAAAPVQSAPPAPEPDNDQPEYSAARQAVAAAHQPSPARNRAYPGLATAAVVAVAAALFFTLGDDASAPEIADAPVEFLDELAAAEPLAELEAEDEPSALPEPVLAPSAPPALAEAARPEPAPERFAPPPAAAEHPKPRLAAQAAPFPDLALHGIFYNARNPAASLNGKILRIGDSIEGAEVVRIEQKRVVLRHAGEERALALK